MPRIRSLITFLLVPLFVGLAGHARAQVTVAQGSRVEAHVVAAPSLAGNLIGDATEKRVLVYVPPGYDPDDVRRYPVVYLLHGIFDSPDVWVEHFGVPVILDRLIDAGRMPPVLVVMPDGGNHLGGGFYRNSPVTGDWASFITEDLVSFVDETYRTDARRETRIITGHSMGGYGALHLSMEHPDVFGVAYAMSPCCLAPIQDTGQGNPAWLRAAELETPAALEAAIEARDFWLVAVIGFMSAFSPAPDNPPFFVAFPFAEKRGETVIVEPTYTEFRERFPLYRVFERWRALKSLDGLALDYGIADQFAHIPEGSRRFSERLTELRVPHRLDVYDGDHREEIAERLERVVFPFIAERLTRPED